MAVQKPPTNFAGQVGWSVGLESWLDDPASTVNRYWRVVEFGSAATEWPWQGRRVAGLWGPNAGPRKALWGTAHTQFLDNDNEKLAPYFSKMDQDMLGPARKALWEFMQGGKGPNMDLLKATYYTKVTIKKRKDGTVRKRVEQRTASTPGQQRKARRALFFWLMTDEAVNVSNIPFVQGTIKRPVQPRSYYLKALDDFPLRERQIQAIREVFAVALSDAPKDSEVLRKLRAEQSIDRDPRAGRGGKLRSNIEVGRYLPRGQVTMAANASIQRVIFDARGKFGTGQWQAQLREANERVAMDFQGAVAALMERGNRPATKALIEATRDRRNRYPRDIG